MKNVQSIKCVGRVGSCSVWARRWRLYSSVAGGGSSEWRTWCGNLTTLPNSLSSATSHSSSNDSRFELGNILDGGRGRPQS